MKKYNIKWKDHPVCPNTRLGQIAFNNGYGASIMEGDGFMKDTKILGIDFGVYGDEEKPYELAVMKEGKDGEHSICYDTHLTDDVIGYLTLDDVMVHLEQIESLPDGECK